MKCSVPGCKNDSRNTSKSKGITFHIFPNDVALRNAWLQAVGKKEWEPKWRSAICSQHFHNEDLYETKSGLRKVRSGAVPIISQDPENCEMKNTIDLMVCRVCLATDRRLYAMDSNDLYYVYKEVTGISAHHGDRLPGSLCFECVQRLNNLRKFIRKSIKANTLMLELIEREDQLTPQNIQSIHRGENELTTNLTVKHFENNHFNLQICEDDKPAEGADVATVHDGITCIEKEIKREILNCDSDIFAIELDDKTMDETQAENDCEHPEKDYSTDDSLPLEVAKLKKQKAKTKATRKAREKVPRIVPVAPKVDKRRKPFLNDDLNETLFTIHELTLEEQLAEIEKRQDSSNYKNAVYKCTQCFKGFLDEAAYTSHMSRHTNECGEYQCNICKTHFKHPHALRKHITAHHTQRFSCNMCLYVTTHRQSARLHERWHKGTTYKCPHCCDQFFKFTTYMGHIRIKHPSDFVCQLCGYSFVSEKGISLHKKLKHRTENVTIPEDGPYCELCNVRFLNSDALNRHMSVSAKHTAMDKEGRQPNKAKMRRRNERGPERRKKEDEPSISNDYRKSEGPIPCEQCGMQLENSRAYHSHFRRSHPDKNRTKYPSMKSPCMCEVCGRMFQSYALLKDHRWVHTGERPFKCDTCDKSFRMKQRLVAHRRVHSAEKATYVCNICGKQFSTQSNRQRHMFIHTGLKPFKCEMCGKSFKHGSEKRAHITYVHLKKPWPKRSRGKRRSDGRQLPMPQQMQPPESDMGLQPMWNCDPKMGDLSTPLEGKQFDNIKVYGHNVQRSFETHPV